MRLRHWCRTHFQNRQKLLKCVHSESLPSCGLSVRICTLSPFRTGGCTFPPSITSGVKLKNNTAHLSLQPQDLFTPPPKALTSTKPLNSNTYYFTSITTIRGIRQYSLSSYSTSTVALETRTVCDVGVATGRLTRQYQGKSTYPCPSSLLSNS